MGYQFVIRQKTKKNLEVYFNPFATEKNLITLFPDTDDMGIQLKDGYINKEEVLKFQELNNFYDRYE